MFVELVVDPYSTLPTRFATKNNQKKKEPTQGNATPKQQETLNAVFNSRQKFPRECDKVKKGYGVRATLSTPH